MILLTGNLGYIGPVMTSSLQERGYKVVGLDYNYFENCEFFPRENHPVRQITKDIRDVNEKDLNGITAIIHLAALSNDPLGEIEPALTKEINYVSTLKLAELAKKIGVERFLFASSCSLYGIAENDNPIDEKGCLNPITSYARSKVYVEKALSNMADDRFHPVYMRNATVYGTSPHLRLDLVVNNLVAWAYLTGKVVIMSDGTPWRPLVHIDDFCRAFCAALEAPVKKIHNHAFNVGINDENFKVKEIADIVKQVVPNSFVEILNKTGTDERSYKVDFTKIKQILPNFKPIWNLKMGVEELYKNYKKFGLTQSDLDSPRYFRVRWLTKLIENGKVNNYLKFVSKTS